VCSSHFGCTLPLTFLGGEDMLKTEYKRKISFRNDEIPLLEEILLYFIDSSGAESLMIEHVTKMMNRLRRNKDKELAGRILYLKRRGFNVSKKGIIHDDI
jgi:hypothetical protein